MKKNVIHSVLSLLITCLILIQSAFASTRPTIQEMSSGQHSLRNLGEDFFVDNSMVHVPEGRLLLFNHRLAQAIGLDVPASSKLLEEFLIKNFSFVVGENGTRTMMATYYQDSNGREVGQARGDGRAVWSGELKLKKSDGTFIYVDVVLKGAGQTPLAWTTHPDLSHRDGLQTLFEAVHSFIMSEVNRQNQLDSTADLAIIELPFLKRNGPDDPGEKAVLTVRLGNQTRVAHLRYHAPSSKNFHKILTYIIKRDLGLPLDVAIDRNALQQWLNKFVENLAEESARYFDVNAVHLAPTAGNRTTKGSTIDLGTFAYLDAFHPGLTYLFGRKTLGGKTNNQLQQMKNYILLVVSFLEEANGNRDQQIYVPPNFNGKNISTYAELRSEMLKKFNKEYTKLTKRLFLSRMGFSVQQRNQLSPETKDAVNSILTRLILQPGERDVEISGSTYRGGAFEFRRIFAGFWKAYQADPSGQSSEWTSLFLTDRSWSTLTTEQAQTTAMKFSELVSLLVRELNLTDSDIEVLARRAQESVSGKRYEDGKEYNEEIIQPIIDQINKKSGNMDFTDFTRMAMEKIDLLSDKNLIPRGDTSLHSAQSQQTEQRVRCEQVL